MRSAVSMELAASYAFEAFRTPRRIPLSDAEFELLATARPFRVGRLAAWQWGRGPVVVLMHGWESHAAHLGAFVQPLVAKGFSVVAFDAPAHGVSPGSRALIPDFARALLAVKQKVGPVHAVVAHSLGTLGTLLAARNGLNVRSLALVAAPSPGASYRAFRRALEMPPALGEAVRERIEQTVGISFEDIEAAALARGLSTPGDAVRGLVIHDVHDKEQSSRSSVVLHEAWRTSELMLTEGLGHRRILRDPEVVGRVVEFVSVNPA